MKRNVVRETYYPHQDRLLSEAILAAINEYMEEDLSQTGFQLYDDINPDGLNTLFREDSSANTTVRFEIDDVTVTLWEDGGIEIRITPRQHQR